MLVTGNGSFKFTSSKILRCTALPNISCPSKLSLLKLFLHYLVGSGNVLVFLVTFNSFILIWFFNMLTMLFIHALQNNLLLQCLA
jgi:hypothetical protein